jgi:NACalpha-BTF3-like transcription factor
MKFLLSFHKNIWDFFLGNKQVEEAAKKSAKEKELAKVSIKKEDVDLIADEMEISKTKAERTLREHAGNIVEALASLTN